jgi:urate oxidase / 2-oxo-4-hydroxy-4-carboxy-5-ureidoimidazoline decarboxylase
MNSFASGTKHHYYGKGEVSVYRLDRTGGPRTGMPVFGASVQLLVYGDAFRSTYTTGDNTGLVATDSMKNFIQRETLNFDGDGLDDLCRFLGEKFMATYPQVEGVQLSAEAIPYEHLARGVGLVPAGPERATARIEIGRRGLVEAASGLRGFRLLRVSGSSFKGFVRDQYTTLPDLDDRPLHMWLDLEWTCTRPEDAFTSGRTTAEVRAIVHDVFESFESGSIQQVIYQMGTRVLAQIPQLAGVHLEAQNRTWDSIAEHDARGVFTEPRPPFGCLGLRLTR